MFFSLFFFMVLRAVATFVEVCTSFFSLSMMIGILWVYVPLQSSSCCASLMHELEHVHRVGSRLYPVIWKKDRPCIIVVPAGIHQQAQYVTAATYGALDGADIDTVILLCQGDENQFCGIALPFGLGNDMWFEHVSIATDCLGKLSEHRLFHYYQVPFCCSFNILQQFKFLKFYMHKAKVIPLFVGSITEQDAYQIATIMIDHCSEKTLIVMSADVGCYQNVIHDFPCDVSSVCKVYEQDFTLIQAIQSAAIHNKVLEKSLQSSVFTLLFALLRLPYFENLASYFVGYATSEVDVPEIDTVCSYGAFIFQKNEDGYKNYIGKYEQSIILQLARTELYSFFDKESLRLPSMISYEMSQPHGLFVSLYTMSDHGIILRGSIGKVEAQVSLQKMACYMTRQAAYKDVRFYPLRYKEVPGTIISLSIVNDLQQVTDFNLIDEFQGLLLQYDDKEAISLPSSTHTHLWNYESALTKLSNQITLHGCLWKKPRAKVFTFLPQVFQEE